MTIALVFFTWGEVYSLLPSACADFFGARNASSNYGFLYSAKGVASIMGGGLAAKLFEKTGSWNYGFYACAVLALIIGVLAIGLHNMPLPRKASHWPRVRRSRQDGCQHANSPQNLKSSRRSAAHSRNFVQRRAEFSGAVWPPNSSRAVRNCWSAAGSASAKSTPDKFPDFLPETASIREKEWTVAPIPRDLEDRRVEITGPVDRKMVINALNSGANVFMADFEDANSPTWHNNLDGQINVRDAMNRTIELRQPRRQAVQTER